MTPEMQEVVAAITADVKASSQRLSTQLGKLDKKVDGISRDVQDLRSTAMKIWDAWLELEVTTEKLKQEVETLKAEVVLLKRPANGSAA